MKRHLFDVLFQDVRFSARRIKSKGLLTIVVVVSLSFGIGAATAVYSLIDAVMLRSLPIHRPEELAVLHWASQKRPSRQFAASLNGDVERDSSGRVTMSSFSYPMFSFLRDQRGPIRDILAIAPGQASISRNGQKSLANVEVVSENYFTELGVPASIGRLFSGADARDGAAVAVLSFDYWSREFGASKSALNTTIVVQQRPYLVIGVAARSFHGLDPGRSPDLWLPINAAMDPQVVDIQSGSGQALMGTTGIWWLELVGRLRSAASLDSVSAQLDSVFLQELGVSSSKYRAEEIPHIYMTSGSKGLDTLREQFGHPVYILATGVILVLLAACANAGMLLLANSTTRRTELAVRLALGASRIRILRQLITEMFLLVLVAGIAGLVLSYWMIHLLTTLIARGQVPIDLQAGINGPVIAFSVSLCVVISGILATLIAIQAIRGEIEPFLRQRAVSSRSGSRFIVGKLLAVAQLGASLMLVAGAGLFLRTMKNLHNENLGFNPDHLLIFSLNPEGYDGPRAVNLLGSFQQRINALPGVISSSYSKIGLISGYWSAGLISIVDHPPIPDQSQTVWRNLVGPQFFTTMGIQVILGRDIAASDTESSPKIAVVNESMRDQFWPGRSPIGEQLTFRDFPESLGKYTVVGIVANAKYSDIRGESPPTVYFPAMQAGAASGAMHFEVRTAGDPAMLVPSLRSAAQEIDPSISLLEVKTQTEQIESGLSEERLFARSASLFGIFALMLAGIGVYGLSAYSVSQRLRDIGIKLALGATRPLILREVMLETLLLVALGGGLGLLGSVAVNRFIAAFLFRLNPLDPSSLIFAFGIICTITVLTTYPAALRASDVEPSQVLRQE